MAHSDVKWKLVVIVPLGVNTSSLFWLAGPTDKDNKPVTEVESQILSKPKTPRSVFCSWQTEPGHAKLQSVAGNKQKNKRKRTAGGMLLHFY